MLRFDGFYLKRLVNLYEQEYLIVFKFYPEGYVFVDDIKILNDNDDEIDEKTDAILKQDFMNRFNEDFSENPADLYRNVNTLLNDYNEFLSIYAVGKFIYDQNNWIHITYSEGGLYTQHFEGIVETDMLRLRIHEENLELDKKTLNGLYDFVSLKEKS